MKFKHQTIIEKNEINVNRLPKDLQASIRIFEEKLKDYETAEEDEDEAEIKQLKAELKKISELISEEIKEILDEDEVAEHEDDERIPKDKEGILRYLFDHGIKKVTKDDLKKYGYPIGFWNAFPIKGETVGNFRLFRNNSDEKYYQLSKVR